MTAQGLHIRETPADDPAAVALIAALDAELGSTYPAESRHGYSVAKLLAEGVRFFVATVDGVPAGCAGIKIVPGAFAEVKRMYVRPDRRGLRLGEHLLDALADAARAEGLSVLRLETGIHQHAAIRLYERTGFHRIPPFPPYWDDPVSLCYEKRLARTHPDAVRWDARYRDPKAKGYHEPAPLLVEHAGLLPAHGLALDVAMGLGGSAGFLLERGLRVLGVDVSEVALRAARARWPGLAAVVADCEAFDLPANALDVIVNFRYTQRSLWPRFARWLRPGGVLMIESFGVAKRADMPDANPAYFLQPGELARAFAGWRIVACHDAHPARPMSASLVALKPA